ncbi:hypothetical protein ACUY3H_02215 [Corynebacterium ureicelerivorans]
MKIHTWLTSGLAARDTSDNPSDYLVWFPAKLDSLTTGPLVGESASVPFYLTPKTSALTTTSEGIVLLGVPLGDLQGNWRADNLGTSTESIEELNDLLGSNLAYRDDGAAVVQLRGEFPVEQIQVVAGQNRPDTKRAKYLLAGVPSDFPGERQFHTMPELFPDELA